MQTHTAFLRCGTSQVSLGILRDSASCATLLFAQGVPDSFVAGRYHSLYGIRADGKWPSCLVCIH